MKVLVSVVTTEEKFSYIGVFSSTSDAVLDAIERFGICRVVAKPA